MPKLNGNTLKSVFRYPGAKSRFLGEIVDKRMGVALREASSYMEAFVGGGSVLLYVANNYQNIERFFVNDFDYLISSFWTCMGNEILTEALADKILNTIPTIELHKELQSKFPEIHKETTLESAYIGLCLNRMSFSGILESGPIGGKTQAQQATTENPVGCRFNAQSIADQMRKINGVLNGKLYVSQVSFEDFIPCHPHDSSCVLYCDPPYYDKGNQLYRCTMDHAFHQLLADTLKQCHMKWFLSYDTATQIDDMYKNWSIPHRFPTRYSVRGSEKKIEGWTSNEEFLIESKEKTKEESGISLQGHPIAAEILGT